jgi:uncharacterized damage-inducible protein DinB
MNAQLVQLLETSRNYTLAVANAMPESKYDTAPVKEVWSFGELLHHIAYGIEWWEANYIKQTKTEWNPPPVKGTRKEVIAYLNKAYDALKTTITQKLSEEAINGFHATIDHITHHRGQATIHLRGQGVVPPDYTY